MTYSQPAIQFLIDRLGWALPVPPTAIVLTDDVKKSNSGRLFNSFHKLATAEQMFYTITNSENSGIDNTALNAYLLQMKQQAVMTVLGYVFDANPRANAREDNLGNLVDYSNSDYSSAILNRGGLYDTAIGLQLACDAVNVILATNRSNMTEKTGLTAAQMKVEVDGATNEEGVTYYKGLTSKRDAAIVNISNILWPPKNKRKRIINATNRH